MLRLWVGFGLAMGLWGQGTDAVLTGTVTDPAGRVHRFEIHPGRKMCLLEGLDDVARTQEYRSRIEEFEAEYRAERPWLYAEKR